MAAAPLLLSPSPLQVSAGFWKTPRLGLALGLAL
jgi:hypothetical protein